MLRILLVGPAARPGAPRRYRLSGAVPRRYGEAFPFDTPAVNPPGRFAAAPHFHHLRGRPARAALNVVASNPLGPLPVRAGYAAAKIPGGA